MLTGVLALAPTPNLPGRPDAVAAAAGPVGEILRADLQAGQADDLAPFYRERGYRPLWFASSRPRPEAYVLVRLLARADRDGLEPRDYRPDLLQTALSRGQAGRPVEAAQAELALSKAFARYAVDLREPPASAQLLVTDPALARRPVTPRAALRAAAWAPSLSAHLSQLAPMNPIYRGLRSALAAYEDRTGQRHDAYAQALRINLARARALPRDADARFVLVDAASARLWLYDAGQVRETMPVAVGKLSEPTPLMTGMIRYAVFNPYWNVPPDLVRDRFAPQVLREGVGSLAAQRLEALSDWSDNPRVLDPATIDWAAVAQGRQPLRLRQTPGPENMMGAVKLMLPNRLGVYLHDTPDKSVFDHATRTFSAGCVRLSNAMALAARLGVDPAAGRGAAAEHRVDLAEPIPVYIAYFTALPQGRSVALARDVYRRDAPVLAELDARRAGAKPVQLAQR